MPYTNKYAEINEGFDILRGERRSTFIPNKVWEELLKLNYHICPFSEFIKQAILEKTIRDDPKKEDYYKKLFA